MPDRPHLSSTQRSVSQRAWNLSNQKWQSSCRQGDIKSLKQQQESLASQIEAMLDDFMLAELLISTPGLRSKTVAVLLPDVKECSDFSNAVPLATHAAARYSDTAISATYP